MTIRNPQQLENRPGQKLIQRLNEMIERDVVLLIMNFYDEVWKMYKEVYPNIQVARTIFESQFKEFLYSLDDDENFDIQRSSSNSYIVNGVELRTALQNKAKELQLSITDFCKVLGISRPTYYNLHKTNKISPKTRQKMEKFISVEEYVFSSDMN